MSSSTPSGRSDIGAIAVHLDPIRAVADLLAHGLPRGVRSVDQLHAVRHLNFRRVPLQRIGAGHIEGARHDHHARAGNHAVVDRLLDVDVGIARALRLQIADGRESVLQRLARRLRPENRAVGLRLLEELLVVVVGGDVACSRTWCACR